MTVQTGWIVALACSGALVSADPSAARSSDQAAGAQAPAATAPPDTEIYLAPFTEGERKTTRIAFIAIQREGVKVERPTNITNNRGYDNQPHFLPDSSGLLFSSNRDGKQTDIYRYDIATKAVTRVTSTPENEYSPTITPDGRTVSTVRGAEQRVWRFNLDGTDAGVAWSHRGLIGYHAWLSPTRIAGFILGADGAPNTLEVADLAAGTSDVIASNIGRSLHIRPGRGTLIFVQKQPGDVSLINEWDPGTRKIVTLTSTLEGSEDLAWTPAGSIVMGAKSKLFIWKVDGDDRWIEFGDLRSAGLTAITRVAVSPDGKWIAIVSAPASK
jgi:dipeptidyl aminopeptidase/acylaminoacyl peptidase